MALRYTADSFRIWLQAEIDRREWSRAKLADQVGVSKATVERWLSASATIKPSLPSVHKIADVLGRDADDLAAVAGVLDRWAILELDVIATALPSGGELALFTRKDGLLEIGYERAPHDEIQAGFGWSITVAQSDLDALIALLKEARHGMD